MLLKQGIDAHFDGAYWMDAENRFVYLNDAACRVLGYTREELLGQPLALINPRATPERLAWVWQRLRTERFYTVESFHRRKDGTEFPVEIVSVLARIGDREFNCGFARDITERKRAEDTLRQEQALFNTLAGNIPDLIYWKDRQSRFIRINDALARRFGLADAKDAVGKTDFDIFADEHARQAFDDEQQVMASGGALIALEEKETWPDGRITWASSTKMPMRDTGGNIIGLFGISRDITERKLADERARQQAALLDRASDAIYVTGLDGTVNYWNQAAERIYGWSAAEAVGRLTADLIPVDESDVATAADEVLQNGEWTGERRQRTKSGRDVDVLSRLTLLNDDQGRPQSILVINTDITELKQLEARFMRAQRLESIGALASGIAHDLNNVLAPIIMGAALLRDTAADDTVRRLVALMESSAQRGAGIVRQVLTFARGSEGQRAVLHLRHLIKDMVKMAEETFPKNIQVVYELPDDLWAIEADPTQMHQVMLNLCVNARDAMPEGGRLTLAGDNATITDETAAQYPGAKPGPHVRLRIIDTGTGIPLEAQERIFEPFFTTKGVGKGTGLGLSTALGIVRSHGGFIRFESAVGRGTTFELFFPAVQAARTTRAPFEAAEPPAGLRGAGGQVLVVDDEAGVREVARQTLEGFGYRVTVAATGAEAIQIFRAAQGDMQLVVTDMMMPELDGPALVRALRAIRPEVPIVGITGVADPATMQQLRALSLAALLAKPFTISDFLTAVRDAIRCLPAGEGAPEPRQ